MQFLLWPEAEILTSFRKVENMPCSYIQHLTAALLVNMILLLTAKVIESALLNLNPDSAYNSL